MKGGWVLERVPSRACPISLKGSGWVLSAEEKHVNETGPHGCSRWGPGQLRAVTGAGWGMVPKA